MAGSTIALFVCNCGTNIANTVDTEALMEWGKGLPDVLLVEGHDLLCSPAGKEFFQEKLKGVDVAGVVVAACSPKMHEKTFQELAEAVGLNMGQVQMANIREHCAWVTPEGGEALEKAKSLISAAIRRCRLHEALEKRSLAVNTDIMILGGGIAGIEAALTAAEAGRKVTIVESDISLGGSVIRTEEVAPNMECAPCLLAPRLSEIRDNPDIEVITNAEVEKVVGFYGNFTATVRKKARAVKDNCIGCEACFDVCPVDVPSAFHMGHGTRKAIHTLFPGSVPAAAVIDKDSCKHFTDGSCDACVAACPFQSIDFEQEDELLEIDMGAIIVSTGLEDFTPSGLGLGADEIAEVYTMPEFERIASSNGPYGGEIKKKDGTAPASIAVVHCAGSLREDGVPWCSRICCTDALKVGEFVRKQHPETTVTNIHDHLVFADPSEMAFYKHQQAEGTTFVRSTALDKVTVRQNGAGLMVEGPDFSPVTADMVVLATGLCPGERTGQVSELLNLDLDDHGFLLRDHELLHATGTSLDGIYMAGCAAGPCGVADAVTQAQAAVGDALSKLQPGREIELEIMTSTIDEDKCGGCKLCISVCPYKAVSYDAEKKVSVVNEAICRGCGTCTASCPTGASMARHFTDEQMYAEIGGVLDV